MTAAACTLGCKVNQYDTDTLLAALAANGFHITDFNEKADLYIINTCTVTHIADRKSRQMIRRARKQNPNAWVAVCGCLAKIDHHTVQNAGADFVFDARDAGGLFEQLPLISEGVSFEEANETIGQPTSTDGDRLFLSAAHHRTRAYIKIQEGCDRFCAYCIVPYVRGPVSSRPVHSILAEAETLLTDGCKEIVLTGIHVASYGKDVIQPEHGKPIRLTLPLLMERVASLQGLRRLRLSSIEPVAVDAPFLDTVARFDTICGHFHLSLQSGCDHTLRRMNRRYTAAEYAEAAECLRAVRPDAALTTDVIVGFPGETDADFEESLRFVEQMRFAQMHVFIYSPRAGTPAATFDNQIPPDVKNERSRRMRNLAAAMENSFISSHIRHVTTVLFETEKDGFCEGHTSNYLMVRTRGSSCLINEIEDVRLETLTGNVITGTIQSCI